MPKSATVLWPLQPRPMLETDQLLRYWTLTQWQANLLVLMHLVGAGLLGAVRPAAGRIRLGVYDIDLAHAEVMDLLRFVREVAEEHLRSGDAQRRGNAIHATRRLVDGRVTHTVPRDITNASLAVFGQGLQHNSAGMPAGTFLTNVHMTGLRPAGRTTTEGQGPAGGQSPGAQTAAPPAQRGETTIEKEETAETASGIRQGEPRYGMNINQVVMHQVAQEHETRYHNRNMVAVIVSRAQGGEIPDESRIFLANLDRQEANRSVAAIAYTQMRDDMLAVPKAQRDGERSDMTVVGYHPNVANQYGGRLLTNELRGAAQPADEPGRSPVSAQVREQIEREMRYIIMWVRTMKVEAMFSEGMSREEKLGFIRERIRDTIQSGAQGRPLMPPRS